MILSGLSGDDDAGPHGSLMSFSSVDDVVSVDVESGPITDVPPSDGKITRETTFVGGVGSLIGAATKPEVTVLTNAGRTESICKAGKQTHKLHHDEDIL